MEDHRAPTGPLPPFISHSAVFSFLVRSLYPSIPPSVPSSPSTLLSSSLLRSLPPSLAPSLPPSAFMLLLIIALTSLPPSRQSPRQSLPYWYWPSPLCLSLDGTEGEGERGWRGRGGDAPDGQTLNSRGEGRDERMKEETRKRESGEERSERRERRDRRGERRGARDLY